MRKTLKFLGHWKTDSTLKEIKESRGKKRGLLSLFRSMLDVLGG